MPVASLLDLGLIPDVLAIVDRDGAWLEREETERAEDLASWHARVLAVLERNRDVSVSVLAGK
jgi:hypothetical protein